MKIAILIFLLFFFPVFWSFGQPGIQWQKTFGTLESDNIHSLHSTSDSSYILGGEILNDCAVIKLDSSGNVLWQNSYGGNNEEMIRAIKETPDGGYIFAGPTNSTISGDITENSIGWDYWVVKLDNSGSIEWQNSITGYNFDWASSVTTCADGGYLVGGYSYSDVDGDKSENNIGMADYWVVKLDSNGIIEWQNTIGGTLEDALFSVSSTSDNGFILGGYSQSNITGDKTENSFGGYDYWIIKLDSSGNISWQKTIGGTGPDQLYSIIETSDHGYVAAGFSNSVISGNKSTNCEGIHYWIVKISNTGNILWQTCAGSLGFNKAFSIKQTVDNGFIVGGSSDGNITGDKTENCIGYDDYWIVKFDSTGTIQWENTIGGDTVDVLTALDITPDGGYILGGRSVSGISGDKLQDTIGSFDWWIIKIEPESLTFLPDPIDSEANFNLYPNPAKSQLTIETGILSDSECRLTISDVTGRTLISKHIPQHSTKHVFDISSFSRGIYFVQLQNVERISRGKFVKD